MSYEIPEIEQPKDGFECMASLINVQIEHIELLWREYVNRPLAKTALPLDTAISSHLEAVDQALAALREEYDSDEDALRPLLTYVAGLEQRRVTFLNSLDVNGVKFSFKHDGVDTVCEDLEEYSYDAVSIVSETYQTNMRNNVNILDTIVVAEYAEKPSTIRRERMRTLGRHGLDVAKIGIGIIGGIAVAKKANIL